MQLFSSAPTSHHEQIRILEASYDAALASGKFQPFVYPFTSLGALLGIIYLCIDHRNSPLLRRCRFLVWGMILIFSGWCIINTRARNPAAAFGVGLVNAWATLWCAVMLVFNDAQTDFRRIERKEIHERQEGEGEEQEQKTNGHANGTNLNANGNGEMRKRTLAPQTKDDPGSTQSPSERTGTLTWQSYPISPFVERLNWVGDVFSSFRGMGWDWRISGLPPPPETVQDELAHNAGEKKSNKDTHVSHVGIRRYHSKRELLRYNIYLIIRNYLILDLLKTMMVNDPYFWNGSYDQRPGYLPASLDAYPVIDQSCRLLVSLAAIYYALETIFAMGPIFFAGVLGDRFLGVRGEAWIYCDQFGSFWNVLDKGLAGWWGGWWHQTFRFGFESPSTRLVEMLGWEKKSPKAKFLQLCVAFTLSGCLHACGSYTQLGDTRPLKGPFTFFALQIFGIGVQIWSAQLLERFGVQDKVPTWLGRTVNFVYVHVWLYHTAPLLVDDFARGGIWLFEPLPISFLRGLGFGGKEDGWFPLAGAFSGGGILRWHSGDRWWNTGLAL